MVKLAPRTHGGHNHFKRRLVGLGVHIDRNTSTVVSNRAGSIHINLDMNVFAKTRQRLVHGVVNKLINKVVKACRVDVTNVNPGTTTNMVGIP